MSQLSNRPTKLLPALLLLTGCGVVVDDAGRLERAQSALDEGEHRTAIIYTKRVLKNDPSNRQGRLLLGKASVAAGDGAGARKELEVALDLGTEPTVVAPHLAKALLLLGEYQQVLELTAPYSEPGGAEEKSLLRSRGMAFLALEQTAHARAQFQAIFDEDPNDLEASLGLATTYQREGEFAEARGILNQLLARTEDDIAVLAASGDLYFEQGDYAAAERVYLEILKLATESEQRSVRVAALLGAAESQLAQSKVDDARVLSAKLAGLAPDSVGSLLLTSHLAYLDQDWSTARDSLVRVLHIQDDFTHGQVMLGEVQYRSGNLAQADMYLTRALADEPKNATARRLLAETRLRLRRSQDALSILDPLLKSAEPESRDLALAARAMASMGDIDGAICFLRDSAEANGDEGLRLQLAETLLVAGRFEQTRAEIASLEFDNADQDFRRAALDVAAISQSGDRLVSIAAARQLVADWPDVADAHMLAGAILMNNADVDSARNAFQNAAAVADDSSMAVRYLAVIDELRGDLAAARGRYEYLLKSRPDSTVDHIALARLDMRVGDVAQARVRLQEVIAANPYVVPPVLALAEILASQKQYDEAIRVLDAAIAQQDFVAELHNYRGLVLASLGRHAAAARSFDRAVAIDADSHIFRLNLAKTQAQMGMTTEAVRTLEYAGQGAHGEDLPTALALASLKAELNDVDGAMTIAVDLQKSFPERFEPRVLEAEVLLLRGEPQAADRAFDAAIDRGAPPSIAARAHVSRARARLPNPEAPLLARLAVAPQDTDTRLRLADQYLQVGKAKEAINEYEIVRAHAETNFVALNNLAWAYHQLGDPRAAKMARLAYEQAPDNASVADTLGWILLETGALEEGVRVLVRAAELPGATPEVRYHLAVGLAKAGRRAEARHLLTAIVQGSGNFESRADAGRLLSDLQRRGDPS